MLWNVSSILPLAKHLATCQLSCNVKTSSKCAIFDKLQEKIRRKASRPAQKVTGPACACVGQKFPTPSPGDLVVWPATGLTDSRPGWLTRDLVGWLATWLAGSRPGWLTRDLVGRRVTCRLADSQPGWLTRAFLVGWLAPSWLVDSRLPVGWLAPSCWLTRAFLLADSRLPVGWLAPSCWLTQVGWLAALLADTVFARGTLTSPRSKFCTKW